MIEKQQPKSKERAEPLRPWKVIERRCGAFGVPFDAIVFRGMDSTACEAWIRKKGSGWRVWRLDGARPPVFTLLKQAAPRQLRVVGPDVARGLPW